MVIARIGGSFAPPLDSGKVSAYRALAADATPEVKEIMDKLCDMVDLFHQTPQSSLSGRPHPSGVGSIIPLENAEIKRIWDAVPWVHECNAIQELFDQLPTGVDGEELVAITLPDGSTAKRRQSIVTDPKAKALRDAAFHLLWYAKELSVDREPITTDKL